MSKTQTAKPCRVSRPSIWRHAAATKEGKSLTPRKHPGPKPKLDEKVRRLLEDDVEKRPTVTLEEGHRFVERVAGVSVSESTLSRLLRRMSFSPKGRAQVRSERYEFSRAAWRALVAGRVEVGRLLFLDERSTSTLLSPPL
jgi:transposase